MIRQLFPDDWQTFRALRLEALELEPDAFLSTHAEWVTQTEAEWRARLDSSAVFIAEDPDPQGLVGLLPDGCVVMVYVRAAARGKGLAQALLQRVQDEARAKGMPRLWLHVALGNQPAQSLYERLGYRSKGSANGDLLMAREP
ncbi:GNAT family N-acetyltransferase [Falsirhodobacter sp. 1013]|uniref:GNAT family N-acetyltransferase n=1 Tax=Falsirhodobacter sp. 1013 TaxID=3417566 RepID=UPI003EBC840D